MDIIKKNLVLFIVIGVSIIASAVLIVFVIKGYDETTESVLKIEEIKKQIKDLQKQRPAPHSANQIRIRKDIDAYKVQVEKIHRVFGQPYADALKEYIAVFDGKMTEAEFMEKFSEFWTQNSVAGSNRYQLFQKFNSGYSASLQEKAKERFKAVFQENTVERMDENNINDIIMSALGVPRVLSDYGFKRFLSQMQEELIKLLVAKNVAYPESLTGFTFGQYMNASSFPGKAEIPAIIDSFLVVGDIVKRIANSNVKEILSLNRGNLMGNMEGKYTRYRFTIEVVSELVNLQRLVASLNDAYRNNRVYSIKNFSIEKLVDKAYDITTDKIEFQSGSKPAADAENLPPGALPEVKADSKKETIKKASVPYYREKGYGQPIVGALKKCKMVLEIDYIVFNRPKFAIQD